MPDGDIRNFQTEAPARVGRFQYFADAILQGCAVTGPLDDALCDGRGNACALGAYLIGRGIIDPNTKATTTDDIDRLWSRKECLLLNEYRERYGADVSADNDSHRFTREQIAARIAALD